MNALPRRVGFCLLVALATPALAQTQTPPDAAAEAVIFGFQPVDGESWRKTAVNKETRDYGDLAPYYELVTEQQALITYQRQEAGWLVTQVAESASMSQGGQPVDNPALKEAIGLEMTLQVNELGSAVHADGFEEFFRRIEKVLDPVSYARYREGNSPESVAANEVRLWNHFYAELLGYEIRAGEVWRVLDAVTVSGARAQVAGTLTFDGWTEIGGVKGFKVTYRYDTSGEIMSAVGDQHTRSISRLGDEKITPNNLECEGTWVRVIHPETGQLLYSVMDQTATLPISAEDMSKKGVFTNHHTHRWARVDS